jgi:hypothetical protein
MTGRFRPALGSSWRRCCCRRRLGYRKGLSERSAEQRACTVHHDVCYRDRRACAGRGLSQKGAGTWRRWARALAWSLAGWQHKTRPRWAARDAGRRAVEVSSGNNELRR